MEYNPSKKGWESITGLPIEEKIIRISNADMVDLVKGVSEVMHDRSSATMTGEGEMHVDLPLMALDKGGTLNELVSSIFKSGRLEVSYRRWVKDSEKKEVESEEVALSHFIWGRADPVWKRRKNRKDDFEEFSPTEEQQAEFRVKCLEAVVRRHERLEKLRKTGKKTIETLETGGGFL